MTSYSSRVAVLILILANCILGLGEEVSMQERAKTPPFSFASIKPLSSDKGLMGSSGKPEFFIPNINIGVKKVPASRLYLNEIKGGVFFNSGSSIVPVKYDGKQILVDGRALNKSSKEEIALLKELGWLLLSRYPDSEGANEVLKSAFHLDLGKGSNAAPSFGMKGLSSTKKNDSSTHNFKKGELGAAGRLFAESLARNEAITSLFSDPSAWTPGTCNSNGECTYSNKNGAEIFLDADDKKAMALFSFAKEPASDAPRGASSEYERRRLSADTAESSLEEMEKRSVQAGVKNGEIKVYVGAEWCPGCKAKLEVLKNGPVDKLPTFFDFAESGSPTLMIKIKPAADKKYYIPKILTFKITEGKLDPTPIKEE